KKRYQSLHAHSVGHFQLNAPGAKMSVYRADPSRPTAFGSKISEMESMRRMLLAALCEILMNLSPLFGQGMTLTGSGYASPATIRFSPVQITTLFVSVLIL